MVDNKTHPIKMQLDNSPDPGAAKATLGNVTHIMSHLIPQQATQQLNLAPQPPSNQQNETDVGSQISSLEMRVFDEISTLKEEIKKFGQPKDQNKEIEDLKNQIEQVLASND